MIQAPGSIHLKYRIFMCMSPVSSIGTRLSDCFSASLSVPAPHHAPTPCPNNMPHTMPHTKKCGEENRNNGSEGVRCKVAR